MYLNMLDNEKKHYFLDLEIYMSGIDGEFAEAEKAIIDAHCIEMRIDNNGYEPELSQEELLGKLRESLTDQEKHIVFLELVGTIMADNVYHGSEKVFVNRLADILEISAEDIEEAFSLINDMKKVYERCACFVK